MNRQVISVLLLLFMVMSGTVLAISEISGGQDDAAMESCGFMMMKQAESEEPSSGTVGDCAPTPYMTCPGASFAPFLAAPNGLLNTVPQPVMEARNGSLGALSGRPSTPK